MNGALYIIVHYKYNQYKVSVDHTGISASDLLKHICSRLDLNVFRHHFKGVNDSAHLKVWDEVTLCSYEESENVATLQLVLWDITSMRSFKKEDLFQNAVKDLFSDLTTLLIKRTRYQLFTAIVDFSDNSNGDNCVLYHWKHFCLEAFGDKGERSAILVLLEQRCNSEGLYPDVNQETCIWKFIWTGEKLGKPILPIITARDLVNMGYNVRDQALFQQILAQLRRAINIGSVDKESSVAQRKWVSDNFPNFDRFT